MHWFKPYSTLFTKIRYVALFEKVLFAEGGAIRASQQKTHMFKQVFASSMESTVSSCYTSLQQCCTLCKQESALSKVKNTCFNECVSKMALFPKPCCSNSRIDIILENSMLHFPTGML